MAKVSFDGSAKIITVTEAPVDGDVSIDCKVDLYSDWKEWVLQDDNSKYEQAMRAVGGDPLPGSKALGVTYFLTNAWKIRPYEANHTLNVNGNLYCEDGSSPYVSTLGAYNVMVISAVSQLVDSTVQQLPEIEHASFNGVVTVDVKNGSAGTAYPQGTPTSPVNNMGDAKAIAQSRGFYTLKLLSDLTISGDESIDDLHFLSENWLAVTVEEGASTRNTIFEKVSLYGSLTAYWSVLIDCWIMDISNFCGWVRGGSFTRIALAPYNIESLGQTFIENTTPMVPGVSSILVMNNAVEVSMTTISEGYEIRNMTAGSTLSVGLLNGYLMLDSSCVDCNTVIVNGAGLLINDSSIDPSKLELDGLINVVKIADIHDEAFGRWEIDDSEIPHQLVYYRADGVTELKRFHLPQDAQGKYISRTPA